MATAILDGISTRYDVAGAGPPLLMFSPGGFDSKLENWESFSIYARLKLLDHLTKSYTCIRFDRRESGFSGGRVERISWASYVAQAVALLDHLGIERAHLMGGCVGCSSAAALTVAHPGRVLSMVLFSPAGGPRYRLAQKSRFAEHVAFVAAEGLDGVVELAKSHDKGFSQDPRVGPWVTAIRTDPEFAARYVKHDVARYQMTVTAMSRTMFDRDTVPGVEAEDLLCLDVPALIVPGQDASHAPSAARYLEECLPQAEFWDVPVAEQTEATAPARVLSFLAQW